MNRIAAVAVLGLFAPPAWSNAGIGFLFPVVPALLLTLPPVILIEAPVLAGILRLPFVAGLKLAASVNLRSTLLGFLFALVTDFGLMFLTGGGMGPVPGRGPLLVALIPMFFFTIWIEERAASRRLPELPRLRVSLAVLAANLLSYAALAATVVYAPPFHAYDQMGYREHVHTASFAARKWQEAVERHWQARKRLAESAAELELPATEVRRGVGGVALEGPGRIVLRLKFPADPEIDGKRLVYEPQVDGDKLTWRCRSPDLAPRYAPYGCREGDGK